MFWKKDEIPELPAPGLGPLPGMPGDTLAMPSTPPIGGAPSPAMPGALPPQAPAGPEPLGPSATFAVPKLEPVVERPMPAGTPAMASKDLELVSVKLDQLKTSLDVINQRLANLERLAQESQHPKW